MNLRAKMVALTIGVLGGIAAAAAQEPAWRDANRSFEDRAAALVAAMTLEEKVAQLQNDTPAIPRLGVPAYEWWNEALHGVARAGAATVFPQAIGIAATFDTRLMAVATSRISFVSKVAAMPMACGNTVAAPARATPCSASFHHS